MKSSVIVLDKLSTKLKDLDCFVILYLIGNVEIDWALYDFDALIIFSSDLNWKSWDPPLLVFNYWTTL